MCVVERDMHDAGNDTIAPSRTGLVDTTTLLESPRERYKLDVLMLNSFFAIRLGRVVGKFDSEE